MSENIPLDNTRQLRLYGSSSDRLGEDIPTEDIFYDEISRRNVNAIQCVEGRRMGQVDPDMPDSAINASERCPRAERVRIWRRNSAPSPAAAPIQTRITAEQLAAARSANEVGADIT